MKSFLVPFCLALFFAGCAKKPAPAGGAAGGPKKILIGLSLDTLKEARWQSDRDYFTERARQLGADVLVLSANSDDSRQVQDVQSLISRGVNVLVIVPHNGEAMTRAVQMADDAGIPVISYDRLIKNCAINLYISFDNVKVGEAQARYLVDHLPTPGKGKIIRIYGAPTDNNAR
ncbi:MAG: substrate-binding domain-containing protein, partial [Verrucomicrobiota bacterium]|nr:substrate-binding domain-containing protein [Verrucomicrobiota bacterium]